MNLQDEHLKQALEHAPDRELMPNDAMRAAVLAYADNALKKTRETWFTRLSEVCSQWFGLSWHLTGIGSAVATVLVVVIFWHELPDDSMRKVAAPNEQTVASETADISTADGVASYVGKRATAEASAENIVQKKSARATSPRKEKSSLPAVSQAPASLANEAQIPTEAASVPAVAPVMQDKAVEESASTGMMSLPEVAQPAPRVELEKKAISSAKLDGMLPKSVPQRNEPANLLIEINTEGGVVTANKDIQALKWRLLALDEQSVQGKGGACVPPTQHPAVIDSTTGYSIETISLCGASASLLREVEAYNQTMRDWHAKHENK